MKWPLILTYTFLTTYFSVSIVGGMIESHHGFTEAKSQRHCRQELVEKFEDLSYGHLERSAFHDWLATWQGRCTHESSSFGEALTSIDETLRQKTRPQLLPEELASVSEVYDGVIRPVFRGEASSAQ